MLKHAVFFIMNVLNNSNISMCVCFTSVGLSLYIVYAINYENYIITVVSRLYVKLFSNSA